MSEDILEPIPPEQQVHITLISQRHMWGFLVLDMGDLLMKKQTALHASSENLFFDSQKDNLAKEAPLSIRMRPNSLQEYIGQEHILGKGKLLTRAIESDRLSSLIFYGPPGVGKTTLAHCISHQTKSHFERINAVCSNVEELRKVISAAQNRQITTGRKTILFIDEIHRFNKAQQDVLMPDVEEGNLILIGATVMNPFFSLISPLLSRSLIFELYPLTENNIILILQKALEDKEKGLGDLNIKIDKEAVQFLAGVSEGDARRALNALEIGCLTTPKDEDGCVIFSLSVAEESIQKKQLNYDKNGDGHYDTASAFIKSMRGSDPDAALYWLAKMIYAGEDPLFIARRICICAAEDVGLADPRALMVANAAMQITEFIGLPEARIALAEAVIYIACAPKSNSAYLAIDKALEDVKTKNTQQVPTHLKGSSYRGAEQLGHGKDYKYAHNYDQHYVKQDYLIKTKKYYEPTEMGFEKEIKLRTKKNLNSNPL